MSLQLFFCVLSVSNSFSCEREVNKKCPSVNEVSASDLINEYFFDLLLNSGDVIPSEEIKYLDTYEEIPDLIKYKVDLSVFDGAYQYFYFNNLSRGYQMYVYVEHEMYDVLLKVLSDIYANDKTLIKNNRWFDQKYRIEDIFRYLENSDLVDYGLVNKEYGDNKWKEVCVIENLFALSEVPDRKTYTHFLRNKIDNVNMLLLKVYDNEN